MTMQRFLLDHKEMKLILKCRQDIKAIQDSFLKTSSSVSKNEELDGSRKWDRYGNKTAKEKWIQFVHVFKINPDVLLYSVLYFVSKVSKL